jgi:hypothetical protein
MVRRGSSSLLAGMIALCISIRAWRRAGERENRSGKLREQQLGLLLIVY